MHHYKQSKGQRMTRKLKTLGLAFVAVLAMSSLAASAAQANFSSANYPATVSGSQIEGTITGAAVSKHEFTTKAGTVKCTTASFAGKSLAGTATELTLTPTYGGCTLAGIAATVNMNGCHYIFTVEKTTTENTVDLLTHVTCPVGGVITVSVTGSVCKVTIAGGQTLKGIETHNEATDVVATIDVSGISYTIDEGPKCPNGPASGTYTDGTYKGLATLQGNNGAVKVT
jgi:hypothetical protein